MAWSFSIGTIAGTAIRVHVTFALLLIWIWLMHYRIGGTPAAMEGIAFIVAVFVCVVLHEFGHIAAARRFGIKTPDITLLPIGGVARLERMPEEPGQEFVIAIAGPLVNVAIAAVLIAILGSSAGMEQIAGVEDPQSGFLARLAGVNVFLVLFNMIPAFPMDGGRVCGPHSPRGSPGRVRPRSPQRSARALPSSSASSACSTILCLSSSPSSSIWPQRRKPRTPRSARFPAA